MKPIFTSRTVMLATVLAGATYHGGIAVQAPAQIDFATLYADLATDVAKIQYAGAELISHPAIVGYAEGTKTPIQVMGAIGTVTATLIANSELTSSIEEMNADQFELFLAELGKDDVVAELTTKVRRTMSGRPNKLISLLVDKTALFVVEHEVDVMTDTRKTATS